MAGSDDFLRLIKEDKGWDALVTYDPYLESVKQAEALADHVPVGLLSPTLVVQKGNPKKIAGMEDLTKPGVIVSFCNPEKSVCGKMVLELFEKKGIKDKVLQNVGRFAKREDKLGIALQRKVIDAAIMWNGMAQCYKEDAACLFANYDYSYAMTPCGGAFCPDVLTSGATPETGHARFTTCIGA